MPYNFAEKKVIDAGSMTGTSTITSDVSDLRGLTHASYQMAWTGTPNGTFAIEVSNDPARGTWTTLTLAGAPTDPAGSASNTGVDLNDIGFRFVRLKYTNASSTGTLNAWFVGKGV